MLLLPLHEMVAALLLLLLLLLVLLLRKGSQRWQWRLRAAAMSHLCCLTPARLRRSDTQQQAGE